MLLEFNLFVFLACKWDIRHRIFKCRPRVEESHTTLAHLSYGHNSDRRPTDLNHARSPLKFRHCPKIFGEVKQAVEPQRCMGGKKWAKSGSLSAWRPGSD